MAENKPQLIEREYTIPLRRHWLNVPMYNRSSKAVKAIKNFVAKHMKVPDRDINKVKIDSYFNNELWFKGRANPPAKIKVKVKKESDLIHVTFSQIPDYVKFLKAKHERIHKKAEEKASSKAQPKPEQAQEIKTEEQKIEEKEKEKSVAEAGLKEAKMQAKAEKHITKVDKAQHPQRMALKK